MLGAGMPWHMAAALPVLDHPAPMASLAPRFVVKLVRFERCPGAIDRKQALWTVEEDALR